MAERDVTRNQAATYISIVKDKNEVIDEGKSTKTSHRMGGDYVHFLPLYYITANRKLTLCLNIPPESCKASVLLNIKDATTLQNRKDDLTFVSLNYPNCSGGAPTLQGIYNVIATPASFALQRQAGITSSLSESSFTVSFRRNCDFIPQTQKPFTLSDTRRIISICSHQSGYSVIQCGW